MAEEDDRTLIGLLATAIAAALRRSQVAGGHLDPEYLSLRALAAYSGLSVRTLRAHLSATFHGLPHYRVGGKILVRRSDFDAWLLRFRATESGDAVARAVDDLVANLR